MLFIKNIDITITLDDIQYQYHLKIIIYKIESNNLNSRQSKQLNQDKNNISESKSQENSYSINKNTTDINNTIENNSNDKHIQKKNYIKLSLTLQPNSETLIEEQIKNITQSIFNNFEDILIKTVPLTKNCESIIIDMNINIVFDFWATWKIADIGDEIVSELKMDGDPELVGTKLNYKYFKKYALTAIVEEVNSFVQEGKEDDNNEWNYKYKVIFQNGQSETLNCVFVSCENGSKTWVSAENDINDKIGIAKLQELSQRKLIILNSMKNYIEKNKDVLMDLYNKKCSKK